MLKCYLKYLYYVNIKWTSSVKLVTPPTSLISHRGGVVMNRVRLKEGGETNHQTLLSLLLIIRVNLINLFDYLDW